MYKFFNKTIVQKICMVLVIFTLFNFIAPNYAFAADDDDEVGFIYPIVRALFVTILDGFTTLTQQFLTDGGWHISRYEDDSQVRVDSDSDSIENGIIPDIRVSPEEIFKNQIPMFRVNFIEDPGENADNTTITLRKIIAKWYVAIRNLVIVGLLSVLVYIGIRIILSSIAEDKAKYKKMLWDWLIALCLVFFLHIIMSSILTITETITSAIGGDGKTTIATVHVDGKQGDDGHGNFAIHNLISYTRYMTQSNENMLASLSYLIIYAIMVGFTWLFVIMYMKRVIYMAFLTMIAPAIALTYPIDKVKDGQAQAFNMWLKEFTFNALLQPFHLLIYTVLVTSALELATTNLIYSVAALFFLLPAEKLLRQMFGFEKASTAGGLGSFAGGALTSSLLHSAVNKIKGGKGGKSGKSGHEASSSDKSDVGKIRKADDAPGLEAFANGDSSSGQLQAGGNPNTNVPQLSEQEQAERDNQAQQTDNLQSMRDDPNATTPEDRAVYQEELDWRRRQEENNNQITQTSTQSDSQKDIRNNKRTISGKSNEKHRFKAAMGAVNWKNVGKGVGRAALGATKIATGLVGATIGATAGFISGAATGDFSKAVTRMAAGATGGAVIGKGMVSGVEGGVRSIGRGIKGIANSAPVQAWREENAGGRDALYDDTIKKQYLKDRERQKYIKDNFNDNGKTLNKEQVQEKMEQMYQYERMGVKQEDFKKALKLEKEIQNRSPNLTQEQARQRAAVAWNASQDYKSKELYDEKTVNGIKKRYADKLTPAQTNEIIDLMRFSKNL